MSVLIAFLAAQAATPVVAPTPAPPAVPERKVCRAELATGSIMPPKRVCHTKADWAAIDGANQRNTDTYRNRAQNGARPGE